MNELLILLNKAWNIAFACIVVLSLNACGVKSSPSDFGNQPIEKKIATPKDTTESGSPLGFPLEYPNRHSY